MNMLRMRHALLLATFVVLAALVAWGAPGTAAAHSATRAASSRSGAGNGTISGTVVNGSKGNAPVSGQTVALDVFVSHAQTQSAATTTTDAGGHFSFSGLDGSGSTKYQLDVRYANGDFTVPQIDFTSGPAVSQTITVYDTTTDPSVLSITNTTVLFSPPDTATGLIPVGVFITFKNSSKLAFAASATAAAGAMPTSLLRFALPPSARNLVLGEGFINVQAVQVDKGFAALATIPPGTTPFAYAYSLPYTGTSYNFQFQAVYPTSAVDLLIPLTTLVDDGDYAAKPPVPTQHPQYQLLEADSVQPGEVLKMRLWGLPVPGEQPDLDQRQLLILGAVLALLLALLIGFYLRRGNLAVALGLLPASALATAHERRGIQDREAERKRLLKVLLALDKQHNAGQLGDAEYQRRRDNTRRKLKALLAESVTSESPAAGLPNGIAAPSAVESAQAAATASPDANLEEKRSEDGGTESPTVPSIEMPDSSEHEPMRTTGSSLPAGGQGAVRPARRRRTTPVGGSR